MSNPLNLILFFTRGVSLKTWDVVGNLDREVALYLRLVEKGANVTFVTYGTASDLAYQDRLPGIRILCNRLGLRSSYYEWSIPLLHARALWQSDIIKSNQTQGAEIALRAARFWRKPLIARCGYLLHDFEVMRSGADSRQSARAAHLESHVFSQAHHVVVTTPQMSADIARRIPSAAPQTSVIPNYVDTENFRPNGATEKDIDILFVGRIDVQKNVGALLEALSSRKLHSVIVGQGSLVEEYRKKYGHSDVPITFMNKVDHGDLPALMNRAKLFVMPSHYEGHPKALIEAMACGCSVLGADSPGINSVIDHDRTGWLCKPDTAAIGEALDFLISRPDMRTKLGAGAAAFAKTTYSLDHIAAQEMALLWQISSLRSTWSNH